MTIGGLIGLILHVGMTAGAYNPPLNHVFVASESSPLQEHFSQISQRFSILIHFSESLCYKFVVI